jgi:hypothetical protein
MCVNPKKSEFRGPLFIVGLSRSGTKLLRDLLNNHSRIHIPPFESKFIPAMLQNNNRGFNKDEALEFLTSTSFHRRNVDRGSMSYRQLANGEFPKVEGFIESALKQYALNPGEDSWNGDWIWGDKTPFYLRQADLLSCHFPDAKFVHIIRDPRDRVLSVKRAWRKSAIRAAELWRRDIECYDKWTLATDKNGDRSFEVRYEELLEDPIELLGSICNFLGVEYQDGLTIMRKPSENIGAAKGLNIILKNNKNKYLTEKKEFIKRIEEIVYPIAIQKDYKLLYAKEYKPLSRKAFNLLTLTDYFCFKFVTYGT